MPRAAVSGATALAADGRPSPVAVLDDDTTGAQEVLDTPVVLDWSDDVLGRLSARAFHVVTNTRAHHAEDAYRITRDAATAVLRRFPHAQLVLRGDSTLRAHLLEEYEALRDVAFPTVAPVLLLVPALPAAGRITLDGVHVLESNGRRTPLHETAYAADGGFAYRSSRLLDWAEERSHGFFAAARGSGVGLADLRSRGGRAVHEALVAAAASGAAAVVAPDAATTDDLAAIAAGLRAAQADGVPIVVRSAPTFAALLGGTLAPAIQPVPRAESLLIVCGSYVPRTTRQLARLASVYPDAVVELTLSRLLTDERESEIERAAEAARTRLRSNRMAAVATPRTREQVADDPARAELITSALARLSALLADEASIVLFKGGITSAVGVRDGLGAKVATVEGPVAAGIALWRLDGGRRCLIFPGNVGDDDALVRLVGEVLG